MINNYYEILGVEKSANLETIKKAFREEIAKYHPENNKTQEAKERFNLIIEAFNVLSDSKKRREYDQMLEKNKTSKAVVLSQKEEKTYKEWQKEAKKKSKKSWESDLTDLLLLDLFINVDIFDGISDGLGDIFGDVGDIFDIF